MQEPPKGLSVGDLVSFPSATAVVSLTDVERVRADLARDAGCSGDLAAVLTDYCLDDPDTRAAFDVIVSGLARQEALGDAFHVQGVYGAGKSHLLAAVTLLCGHPALAWPALLKSHPTYAEAAGRFAHPRLVAAIALDEYPVRSHPLEHIVFSKIEREFAARHGLRVALSEQSYVLELVEQYVVPQAGRELDEAARLAEGCTWDELRERDAERAAQVAVDFVAASGFPLDWRRSRVEAFAELRRALETAGLDGAVVVLDELGLFLAGKDRRGLNADASFLQWLAQRTGGSRCWLICATQRGFEEVGDIDRRTLRQLRDRFRTGFTLDLSGLEWIVQHKLAPRRDSAAFASAMDQVCSSYRERAGEELLSASELASSYPLNRLCLKALRRAAETCLSRTRSVVKLLGHAARENAWLSLPADRLITPDVVFDVFRDELAMSVAGRKHLEALEGVMANASRIGRGSEARVAAVMKALCLLGVGELRWNDQMLRASMVGCEEAALWEDEAALRSALQSLYLRSGYVERVRREDGDEYFVDVSSGAAERIRQRLGELMAELGPGDSRVLKAALEAGRDAAFPIASLAEPRTMAVKWLNSRRLVHAICADLCEVEASEFANQVAALASPMSKEDGSLFLASPLADPDGQEEAWGKLCNAPADKPGAAIGAWIPAALSDAAREHLVEHAALSMMVADRTLFRRSGDEARQKVRERWAASEAEVRAMLQRAYYEGRVVGVDGRALIEPARLWALFGDWEATLTEVFGGMFSALYPRHASVAPSQPLTGRLHTNQIIDQFIRPADITLPPASTLEAHLSAFAAPLGLVDADGRRVRLTLSNSELVQAALAATPARTADEVSPEQSVAVNELIGRMGKREWGLTREQGELLVAALLRTGHLVGLDAFLQPVRLDQVAAPLGDSLPFVMRGVPLTGAVAETVCALWQAASGSAGDEWDLSAQESAWSFFASWGRSLASGSVQSSEAITRAALELGHPMESWDWAREALGCAEALARAVDSSLSSREGLAALAAASERLPGGTKQTCALLADWRSCVRFLSDGLPTITSLRRLVSSIELGGEDGALARGRQAATADLGSSARVVSATDEVMQSARKWLESYRKHYLAWHARVHAAARFEALLALRRSALLDAVARLAHAGLRVEEAAGIDTSITAALGKRCLVGDPLPEGHTTCPLCGVAFKQELALPDPAELEARATELLKAQIAELAAHGEMLRRRAAGADQAELARAVEELLGQAATFRPGEVLPHLTDSVVAWLRQQLAQPTARKRELSALVDRLRGKELTKAEVMRVVEEWLGEGDEVVHV